MAKTGRVALAQTVFHNKESVVLIRAVKRGLVLHFLFFKDEIRDFDAIAKGEDIKLPSEQSETPYRIHFFEISVRGQG